MLLQFALFSAVGLLSALADLLCLWLLVQAGTARFLAVSLAFGVGLLVNIVLHARITFQVSLSSARTIRFLTVAFINYLITLAVIGLFDLLSLSYLLGKLVSLPLVALNGYMLGRRWVFKP